LIILPCMTSHSRVNFGWWSFWSHWWRRKIGVEFTSIMHGVSNLYSISNANKSNSNSTKLPFYCFSAIAF
jgi:hypothetical protein